MIRLNLAEGFEQNRKGKRTAHRLVLFVFSVLTLAWPMLASVQAEVVMAPPAPTLVAPTDGSSLVETKPLITGLSVNDTWVKIFIDGVFNGQFRVQNHVSGTANFGYEPFLHLKPGQHTVTARAMDTSGRQSGHSTPLRFMVEYPYPAPTLIGATLNAQTTEQRPWLVGVALNDSLVKVYIDGRYNGQLMVKNDASGVGNFAYRTLYPITPGRHTAFVIAEDADGKASQASKWLEFTVTAPVVTAPAGEVKGEETAAPDTDSETDANTNGNTNGNTNANGNQSTENTNGTEGSGTTNESENANESAAATNDTDANGDDNSRWPLIVGLTVLAVVIIVMIDNMVRRSRSTNSTPPSPTTTASSGSTTPFPSSNPQNTQNRPAKEFFPPAPKK